MNPNRKNSHREYALLLTLFTLPAIFFLQDTDSLFIIIALNTLAIINILYSAFSVVNHADILAYRYGEPYGAVLLSLSVVLLEVSLITIIMSTGKIEPLLMRDTIYSIIMIAIGGLVGLTLLVGGAKFDTQRVNLGGILQYLMAIVPLSIIALVLPVAFPKHTFNVPQKIIVSIISAVMYGIFLVIQTKTHKQLFKYETKSDREKMKLTKIPFSCHSNTWHMIFLLLHLICVIAVTKINAVSLDRLLAMLDAPPKTTGFLVAFLLLSPEGLSALKAGLRNQVQRAMNIFFGSVLATISLTVTIVSTIAIITNQKIIFALSLADIIIMCTTFILSIISFGTGKTNQLNGIAHLTLFVVYLMILLEI